MFGSRSGCGASSNFAYAMEGDLVVTAAPDETSSLLVARHRSENETSLALTLGHSQPDPSIEGASESLSDTHYTWIRETRTVLSYTGPLIVTFVLQYAIDFTSVVAAGRLGSTELGAVSLANMSAIITCFGLFQGLTTSLDTLCAQAYGSGEKTLVGLYCQRMMILLLVMTVPIAILWILSNHIVFWIAPSAESASLCALYLRILILGIPGYGAFETGKRFFQAQGLFRVTAYALLIGTPTNIFLMWLLIWKLKLGFVGAPIAVVITRTLLPLLLLLYVLLVDGKQCWGGLSKRAFANMWSMICLAVPGMIMVEAEMLSFEVMTVVSGKFGVEYLAAQSVLINFATLSYQIPFSISIAASTRVANLIGAGLVSRAKMNAKVGVAICGVCALINFILYIALRAQLPRVFTADEAVVTLVTSLLPLVGAMSFLDGLGVAAHGLLRAIGRQAIGGPANLISYYAVSLPIGIGLAIGLDWKIFGLWTGQIIGLIV